MSNQEVREIIASLREGDEVEADFAMFAPPRTTFTITGEVYGVRGGDLAVGHRWLCYATAIRVIKRAPLPEPPVGTPVWWNGRWWAVDLMWDDTPDRGDRWYVSLGDNNYADRRRARWADMTGAVPAATPEEKP